MENPAASKRIVRFAEFELDLRAGELRTNGHHVILPEKPFQILAALLERPGEMVTRDELVKRLWPAGTFVDFNLGLNKAVNRLREVLEDSAEQPRFIGTIPKRGYRFVAPVVEEGPAATSKISADVADSLHVPASDSQFVASGGVEAAAKQGYLKAAALVAFTLGIALAAGYALHNWLGRSRKPNIEKIQVTKLTDSGKVHRVAISPDGRYVCYALWGRNGLGLWLRQVATGSDTQILPADAVGFSDLSFSPEGNYIYYVRADKNDPGFNYLYVMPVLGGPPRLLVEDIDSPVSFSPNGKQFVYTRGMPAANANEIRIANADGSGNHLLATVPNTYAGFQAGATWSPDGRTIAVPLERSAKQSFTLYAVSVSDGSVRALYSSSKAIGRPLWLPEGDTLLLVMGDQSGRGQLWTISYPKAEIRRVTNDLTNYGTRADLTRDAKVMAAVANQYVANVWVAPAGHEDSAKQITSIALPLMRISESPDGRLLAVGQDGKLWSVRADGTERAPFTNAQNADAPTPCGRYVVFTASRTTSTDLVRVDGDGSNPATLVSGDLAGWSLVCTRDGKYVFYTDSRPPHMISRIPVEGGTPVKIAEILGEMLVGTLTISPDDRFLAYPYEEYTPAPVRKLEIIPAKGNGPARTIPAPEGANWVGWSPDGKNLQYIRTENGASNIWELPLNGGKPRQLTHFPTGEIFDFHWSLDSKQLLLSRGEISSDVVLLSNLR
ncbi:MAG TPA: winged helix-turn-helix domain-containing protein [Candidatus Acidoferrum sp.]|nr:winged helix-turn-helix domain-containing protein [Candidatus Acidoferrum sp.]